MNKHLSDFLTIIGLSGIAIVVVIYTVTPKFDSNLAPINEPAKTMAELHKRQKEFLEEVPEEYRKDARQDSLYLKRNRLYGGELDKFQDNMAKKFDILTDETMVGAVWDRWKKAKWVREFGEEGTTTKKPPSYHGSIKVDRFGNVLRASDQADEQVKHTVENIMNSSYQKIKHIQYKNKVVPGSSNFRGKALRYDQHTSMSAVTPAQKTTRKAIYNSNRRTTRRNKQEKRKKTTTPISTSNKPTFRPRKRPPFQTPNKKELRIRRKKELKKLSPTTPTTTTTTTKEPTMEEILLDECGNDNLSYVPVDCTPSLITITGYHQSGTSWTTYLLERMTIQYLAGNSDWKTTLCKTTAPIIINEEIDNEEDGSNRMEETVAELLDEIDRGIIDKEDIDVEKLQMLINKFNMTEREESEAQDKHFINMGKTKSTELIIDGFVIESEGKGNKNTTVRPSEKSE